MKLLKCDCMFETVKLTDDYPPVTYPRITYGIHRTLMDAMILISGFNKCSILDTLRQITIWSNLWIVKFPMKEGLIDLDKCPPRSPYYTFADWIQNIGHSIERKRSSGPILGLAWCG